MLKDPSPQQLEIEMVTLESLVPQDHLLRKIDLLWRQWKRPYTRARMLMKAGLDEVRAWSSASNQRGPWWNAGASHMNQAYKKRWFEELGLESLLELHRQFQS